MRLIVVVSMLFTFCLHPVNFAKIPASPKLKPEGVQVKLIDTKWMKLWRIPQMCPDGMPQDEILTVTIGSCTISIKNSSETQGNVVMKLGRDSSSAPIKSEQEYSEDYAFLNLNIKDCALTPQATVSANLTYKKFDCGYIASIDAYKTHGTDKTEQYGLPLVNDESWYLSRDFDDQKSAYIYYTFTVLSVLYVFMFM